MAISPSGFEEYQKALLQKTVDEIVENLDNKIKPLNECMGVTYSYNHFADVYVQNGAIYLHNEKIISFNELKFAHFIENLYLCTVIEEIIPIREERLLLYGADAGN